MEITAAVRLRCEEEDLLGLKFENLVQALSGKRNAVPKAHASLDDFFEEGNDLEHQEEAQGAR